MNSIERRISREAKKVTREIIIKKGKEKKLTWKQAAQILGLSARHVRRIRKRYAEKGAAGLVDRRGGLPRKKQIPPGTAERMCDLKRGKYAEFSVKHFYDVAVTEHQLEASYAWLRLTLLEAGLAEKAPRRGTYRRRRPRQPMVGMRVHTDGSTHAWLGEGLPIWDLVIMLDDADGRLLAARFVPEESVQSTFQLLEEVLTQHGRFGELYHDRGSMYCRTSDAKAGPDAEQAGQVSRALQALGIGQIWAYSPQARGRCERAFGTIQGRLCAELKVLGITDYEAANAYLQDTFIPDFNRRFTVVPTEPESAFVPLGMTRQKLRLLLSSQFERTMNKDYTVHFERRILQLPEPKEKPLLYRRKVLVHVLNDQSLAVSHQGQVLSYFDGQDPSQRKPLERRYGPLPTLPERVERGRIDLSDPDFWASLARDSDPIVRRYDLYQPQW